MHRQPQYQTIYINPAVVHRRLHLTLTSFYFMHESGKEELTAGVQKEITASGAIFAQ